MAKERIRLFNFLVVDDELWTRKGIISELQYLNLPINIIEEAVDGEDAMGKIEQNSFDVVITDIKMPRIDGLELVRNIKEKNSKIQFVIISGYEEFEYVKQAMNMGVLGYILKPIEIDQIKVVIQKAIRTLEHTKEQQRIRIQNRQLKDYHMQLICEKKLNELFHDTKKDTYVMEPKKWIGELGYDNQAYYVLGIIHLNRCSYYESNFDHKDFDLLRFAICNIIQEIDDNQHKIVFCNNANKNQILVIIVHDNKHVLSINSDEFITLIYSKITKYLNVSITIGMSQIQNELTSELYKQAKEAVTLRLIHGINKIYKWEENKDNIQFSFPLNKLKLVRQYIEQKDWENIERTIKQIFHYKNFLSALSMHIWVVWIEIVNMMIQVSDKMGLNREHSIQTDLLNDDILSQFDSLEEIANYLYQTVIAGIGNPNDIIKDVKMLVKQVKQYIEHYYQEVTTIKELAFKLGVNPSYFSTIFKQETNYTLLQYITDVRIRNACVLLKETQANVENIAKSVGYQDPQYFYRVFKKYTGQTPLGYRGNR
jgi:YesN/AraC family two-component response regulator